MRSEYILALVRWSECMCLYVTCRTFWMLRAWGLKNLAQRRNTRRDEQQNLKIRRSLRRS